MTGLERVMSYYSRRAIVLRGTVDQVALARWLILALDKPADSQPVEAQEYRMKGVGDLLVRVFYLTSGPPEQFQETVNLIRSTTRIMRVVACLAPRAIAMRGTPGQIAMAARIVQERNSATAR